MNKMLLELEDFRYTVSINLNIVYYHIQLIGDAPNLYTNILP